mgnify:CR=1 FL=1
MGTILEQFRERDSNAKQTRKERISVNEPPIVERCVTKRAIGFTRHPPIFFSPSQASYQLQMRSNDTVAIGTPRILRGHCFKISGGE